MIEVEKLAKVYPQGVKAVSDISFRVQEGEFFGFLGPNGAGKTTTMKVLSTLLAKTSGRGSVAGYDLDGDPLPIRQSIGFAMQDVGLDDLATGREHLVFQGLIYHLPRAKARQRAEELLALVGLEEVANRRVGTYSGGMRRRLDLACALVHSPRLLFLDEPTTGLDPQSRIAVWEHLEKLNREEGITIFLTTQYMEEADRLCRRLAIIDRGQIVAEGTPSVLKAAISSDVLTLRFRDPKPEVLQRVESLLAGRPYVTGLKEVDGGLTVFVQNGASIAPEVLRHLQENGVEVASLSIATPTLEDVFLKHTGRRIRGEDSSQDVMSGMIRAFVAGRR